MNTDELCDQIIEFLFNEFDMPFTIAVGPSRSHYLFQNNNLDLQFPVALNFETSVTSAISKVKRWIKINKSNIELENSYMFDAEGTMRKE